MKLIKINLKHSIQFNSIIVFQHNLQCKYNTVSKIHHDEHAFYFVEHVLEVENMAAKSLLNYLKKKNSKPLFEKHGILAIQNLYTYHCFMEIFKILKFQDPFSMHSFYKFSTRYTSDTLITPVPSMHFS